VSRTKISIKGISMPSGSTSEPVDVLLDDQWVWSFSPTRDATTSRGWKGRMVSWPPVLVPHLRGRSQVSLVCHTSRNVLFDEEVVFTDTADRVTVLDAKGHPLGVDKGGRLQRRFDDTDQSVRTLIVETVDQILTDLREAAGLDAFLAFGCLLGAVRSGKMIGHDADADVAYLSKHTHPLDIIRENRAAARRMRDLGYRLVRMSAADFKIWVPLPDGRRCGVDVFGGYFFQDEFFLLPTVHGTLGRSSLLPTSTVTLEGRELAAPAKPEDLLAVTYGPDWRTPDPAFKFEHPQWLSRHMDGYWRGSRNGLRTWTDFYRSDLAAQVPKGPSPAARWANDLVGDGEQIIDLGAGTGRDALWFAKQGHPVIALDFSKVARKRIRSRAVRAGADVKVRHINFRDAASVLLEGARLAHDPRPRHVYSRMLLEEIGAPGRNQVHRFARMVTRRGGLTLLEFRVRRRTNPQVVIEEIIALGGTIESHEQGVDLAPLGDQNPQMCRLVVRWQR
jgi:hypothetical protein